MSTAGPGPVAGPAGRTPSRATTLPALVAVLLVLAGLSWAKWWPYAIKVDGLADSHRWSGGALLDVARSAPTWWQGAWDFLLAYTQSVWKALAVGLVLAAAIEAVVPMNWVRRVLTRRSAVGGAAVAGAAALPSMMCTCCSAPVAVSLRREGVPVSSVVAYWLANPVLNPAVLVFLALVGPWQWVLARLGVGIGLVLAAGAVAARLVGGTVGGGPLRRRREGEGGRPDGPATAVWESATTVDPAAALTGPRGAADAPAPVRFVRALGRLAVTLVPEYLGLVLLVGAAAHVLRWDGSWVTGSVLGLVALAALALLMVIPTGGEIPVLLALAAAGAGPVAIGLVLIALPAVSLPSLLMVLRALTARVVLATAALAVLAGILAGAVLAALPA